MAIRFIEGRFQINGLLIKTEKELSDFINKAEEALRKVHPSLRFVDDVELEVDTKAGNFEE